MSLLLLFRPSTASAGTDATATPPIGGALGRGLEPDVTYSLIAGMAIRLWLMSQGVIHSLPEAHRLWHGGQIYVDHNDQVRVSGTAVCVDMPGTDVERDEDNAPVYNIPPQRS